MVEGIIKQLVQAVHDPRRDNRSVTRLLVNNYTLRCLIADAKELRTCTDSGRSALLGIPLTIDEYIDDGRLVGLDALGNIVFILKIQEESNTNE